MEKQYESRDGKYTVKVITDEILFLNGANALAIYKDKNTKLTNCVSVYPTNYGFCVEKGHDHGLDVIEIKPDLGLYLWAFQSATTKDWTIKMTAMSEKDAENVRFGAGYTNKAKAFKLEV